MEAEIMELFRQIYAMLEDEESKYIYLNRLNYLISRDFGYMENIIDKFVRKSNNTTVEEWIEALPPEKPIILYGAGNDAMISLPYFNKDPRFIGFCDRDENKQKSGIARHKVFSPEDCFNKLEDITIVISSHIYKHEIRKFLLASGVDEKNIYDMHPQMCDYCEGQYFNPDFMIFEEEEIFVDAGSYNLASVKELESCCKNIKKVYAFEPDPENYKICLRYREQFRENMVELLPYGTWSERTTLYFNASGNPGSKIADAGQICIEVMPIDEAVDLAERVTFIKMDVEGSELESLKGAQKTIMRDKPKLAICIYHKPEDMITLPLYIKSLVPEYKLYLRHHSASANETVLYAMP